MKKVLLRLCTFFVLVGLMVGMAIPVSAEVDGGSCGENVTWLFDTSTKILTISGEGEMKGSPWLESYKNMIEKVVIEDGVTSIASCAFYWCSNVESVIIPNSVTEIGIQTFFSCWDLKSINIPKSVISIGENTFMNCPEACQEENGIYYIDKWVVGYDVYDSSIKNVVLRSDTVGIVEGTFSEGTSLTSIVLPDSLKTISYRAFDGCTGLTNVTFGNDINEIGNSAFRGCTNLSNLVLPNSVNVIRDYAFSGCTNLASLNIPSGVNNIYPGTFKDCVKLVQVENGISYVDKWVTGYDGTIENVSLRSDTIGIANSVFTERNELISVIIPDGAKTIGSYAFEKCYNLKNVTIPDSITNIGRDAFRWCSELESIDIPNGISTVPYGAFEMCSSLKSVEIPDGVTTIEDYAFLGCSGIINLKLSNDITAIGEYVFQGCDNLVNIEIPNSIVTIGEGAFEYCSKSLEQIVVQNGNENYHSDGNCLIDTKNKTVLLGCKNSVIPTDGSVEKIGNYAFWGCTGLKEIQIPKSVTSIGESSFAYCSQIKKVVYSGTEEQWNSIIKGEAWNEGTVFEVVFQPFANNANNNAGTGTGDSNVFDADGDLTIIDGYVPDKGIEIAFVIGIGVVTVACGGASIWWFAIKKKKFSDLAKLVKKTPKVPPTE